MFFNLLFFYYNQQSFFQSSSSLLISGWSPHFRNDLFVWDDFFGKTKMKKTTGVFNKRQVFTTSCYLYRTYFNNIPSKDIGGAININGNSQLSLLIEKSTFIKCTTENSGGAIYTLNLKKCGLYHVCGFDCGAIKNIGMVGNCAFAFLHVEQTTKSMIYLNSSSISSCNIQRDQILSFYNGRDIVDEVNCSKNKCGLFAGLAFWSGDIKGVTVDMTYTSISDNTATTAGILHLNTMAQGSNGEHKIKNCNINNNKEEKVSSSNGLIDVFRKTTFENSCMINNKCNYFYYINEKASSVTMNGCNFNSNNCKYKSNAANKLTEKQGKSFINDLKFVAVTECTGIPEIVISLRPRRRKTNRIKTMIFVSVFSAIIYNIE